MLKFSPKNLDLPEEQIADRSRRWRISRFALFGSVLRDDFDQDSDLDVLITLAARLNGARAREAAGP